MTGRASSLVLLLTAVAVAHPAENPPSADEAAARFLRTDTAALSKRFLDGAATLAEWREKRPRLHQQYFDMLGLWPLPERTPLKATVTGTVARGPVVVEKLHYQSRPGLYVTANLYRPKDNKKRLPAILYVCGHSGRGRDGNKTAFQDHGMWFARNGYVCLVVDTLQLGEIAGKHHGTYHLDRWWWHSRGYTPAGVECWNGVRGIDYLCSRPDVDAERIGVTGISGGGAATIWVAAADDRVKVAVPVSGMSDLESYVSNRVINGHCDCMFLYNLHRWEWTTIAALIAPRPLLFANSDNDPIFPMDGNRRIIARLRQAYKLYDKPDLVDDYVSVGGHDYRPDLRLAIFRWLNRHLKGDAGPVADATDKDLPGMELRVFAEDKDIPKDARNVSIDETFVPLARPTAPPKEHFPEWKARLTDALKSGPFRHLTDASPFPTRLRPQAVKKSAVSFLLVRGENDDGPVNPEWAAGLARETPAYTLLPRGIGPLAWTRKSPPNYVERAHVLLGRTVDLGRVEDVLAAVRQIRRESGGKVVVGGRGQAGILAAYAALLDPAIAGVLAVEPPPTHRDGPHFLGVQRILEVPDALGLLVPRPLTLVGARDRAFERTEAAYAGGGAADRLTRKK